MKKLLLSVVLLTGSSSPAYAHTLSLQEGTAALYHQLLGIHHLPLTALLIAVGVALYWSSRKRTD
jgi:EamA domain-containing membrane protein RarD